MGHQIDPHPQAALARSGQPYNRFGIWRGTSFGVRPPVVLMAEQSSPRLRDPLLGRVAQSFAGFRRLVRQRGMRHRTGPNRRKSVHFGGPLPYSYMGSDSPSSLRPPLPGGPLLLLAALLYVRADCSTPLRGRIPLRGWLRLSLALSLRGQGGEKGRYRALQRGLRACGFADIPTPLPIQNKTKEVYVMFSINLDSASLAPDACAIATALAPQRLSITSATEIALVPGTPTPQPITGSALLSQPLAVNRPLPRVSA